MFRIATPFGLVLVLAALLPVQAGQFNKKLKIGVPLRWPPRRRR
jgi:hypothetical protein